MEQFYKFVTENKVDVNEVMRLQSERMVKQEEEKQQRAAVVALKRKQHIARLEKERAAAIEHQRLKEKWDSVSVSSIPSIPGSLTTPGASSSIPTVSPSLIPPVSSLPSMCEIYTQMEAGNIPNLSPLSGSDSPVEFIDEADDKAVEVLDESSSGQQLATPDSNLFNYIFTTPMEPQTAAVRPQGKSIDVLRDAYMELEQGRLEEHVDKRNYRRSLFLKKKEQIVESYGILSRVDKDIVVTAENKFKELKFIYNEKQENLTHLVTIKDKLATLELIASRYVLLDKTAAKKK